MTELRIIRKQTGDYGHPSHIDVLQFRSKEWIGNDQFWGDWKDVPVIDENSSNKSVLEEK